MRRRKDCLNALLGRASIHSEVEIEPFVECFWRRFKPLKFSDVKMQKMFDSFVRSSVWQRNSLAPSGQNEKMP